MAKSVRCRDCRVGGSCEGLHINMVRDQGLSLLQPVLDEPDGEAISTSRPRARSPLSRLANGRSPEPAARSLPGFPQPTDCAVDPLGLIEQERLLKKVARARPLKVER